MFGRILVLSPHTDDGEFGCGGTIARLIEEGKEVHYAVFSICEDSVSPEYPKEILEREFREAMQVLGVNRENLHIYKFKVRHFPTFRQDILEEMIKLKDNLNPGLVLSPSINDLHQDHSVIAAEGLRAFKATTMLGYEIPWNNITFNTVSFIPLQERHVKKKSEAMLCYKSQSVRGYADPEFIFSLAKTRGTQIGTSYSEVFEVVRWIIRI
jgi:LmbE family N-acetylglucosaminyl deacetylase